MLHAMSKEDCRVDDSLIEVRGSLIHGAGVFARTDIPQGERIIEYVGEKIGKREAGRRVDASIASHRQNQNDGAVYIFELNKRYDIDGNVPYNLARHINHSCDPNAEAEIVRGRIWIAAIKDIKKGDEITYNYGYDFDKDYIDHPCRCGRACCVGYILKQEHWPQLPSYAKRP